MLSFGFRNRKHATYIGTMFYVSRVSSFGCLEGDDISRWSFSQQLMGLKLAWDADFLFLLMLAAISCKRFINMCSLVIKNAAVTKNMHTFYCKARCPFNLVDFMISEGGTSFFGTDEWSNKDIEEFYLATNPDNLIAKKHQTLKRDVDQIKACRAQRKELRHGNFY